jgi:tetratricopeptide (TPR) repeat protein
MRWLCGLCLLLFSLSACAPDTASVSLTPTAPNFAALINQKRIQGDLHGALYYVQAAGAANGWTPALHEMAGDLWRRMGATREALPHYEAAAQDNNPNTLRILADMYLKTGQPAEALQTILKLLQLIPSDAWANYQAGLLLAPSDPRRARDYLSRVVLDDSYAGIAQPILTLLREQPDDTFISFRVGAALAQAEQWLYAELAFQYAADINYPYPEALAYVGLMRDFQGEDGGDEIAAALAMRPNNSTVRMVDGLHRRAKQEYDGSLIALSGALALDPRNPALHAEVATAYQLLGRYDQAEYWYRSALTLSAADPDFKAALDAFYTQRDTFTQDALEQIFIATPALPQPPD